MEGDVFYPQPEELYLIPAGVRHSYSHDPIHPYISAGAILIW